MPLHLPVGAVNEAARATIRELYLDGDAVEEIAAAAGVTVGDAETYLREWCGQGCPGVGGHTPAAGPAAGRELAVAQAAAMIRHCNGSDPFLIARDNSTPCACGLTFDDEHRSVLWPHTPIMPAA